MHQLYLVLLGALASLAVGSPGPAWLLQERATPKPSLCSNVDARCTSSELPHASAYCSSLFQVTTTTITEFAKTVSVAPTCGTNTAGSAALEEHAAAATTEAPRPKPNCFGGASNAADLSSSCDCLSINRAPSRTVHSGSTTVTGPFRVEATVKGRKGIPRSYALVSGDRIRFSTQNKTEGTLFNLFGSGLLEQAGTGNHAQIIVDGSVYPVLISGGYNNITCTLDEQDCTLACSDPYGPSTQTDCQGLSDQWYTGAPYYGIHAWKCVVFTPIVLPLGDGE